MDGVLSQVTFVRPYNNIILIIMVVYAFNTTLYSGSNIYQVAIFFIKRKPTIRALKVNIKKNLNTVRSMGSGWGTLTFCLTLV